MSIEFQDDLSQDEQILSEINTTPLVDVMLVLLIIFLIAVPVINTSVAVRLPREVNALKSNAGSTAVISVDASGALFWFDAPVKNRDALVERLHHLSSESSEAEIQIRGDSGANFESIAMVLNASQSVGITRIGFITESQE